MAKNNKLNELISKAKKELLNLGTRNPLLKFKLPKSRGIEFSDNAVDIYDKIKNHPNNIEILPLEQKKEGSKKQDELFIYDFGDEQSKVFFSNSNLPLSNACYYIYLDKFHESTNSDAVNPPDSDNFCYSSKAMFWLKHCDEDDPVIQGHRKNIQDLVKAQGRLDAVIKNYTSLLDQSENLELDTVSYSDSSDLYKSLFPELTIKSKPKSNLSSKKKLGIQTNYDFEMLNRRLKSTTRDAKNHIEEKGVNVLYLALGSLNWSEDNNRDDIRNSPLILIPISLSGDRRTLQFFFKCEEEEVGAVENLTLRTKLNSDYSINLPEFNSDSESFSLEAYFDQVQHLIDTKVGWSVDRNQAVISFFNFNKLVMFQDLDEAKWTDENNSWSSLIEILLDPQVQFTGESSESMGEEDFVDDFVEASEPTTVIDADSSQIKAILDVRNGKNLVIQGPPGTGKSQTITNIIADSIRQNKTVLFVAEKMVALEVVSNKLADLGLDALALELHSKKGNKKEFYDALAKVMEMGRPLKPNEFIGFDELHSITKELNRYMSAVNKRSDAGWTVREIYGHLLKANKNLEDIPYPEFLEINDKNKKKVLGLKKEQLEKIIYDIDALSQHIKKMGEPCNNPFYGSSITTLNLTDKKKIESLINKCIEAFQILQKNKDNVYEVLKDKEFLMDKLDNLRLEYEKAPSFTNVNFKEIDNFNLSNFIEIQEALFEYIKIKNIGQKILSAKAWGKDFSKQRTELIKGKNKGSFSNFFNTDFKNAVKSVQAVYKGSPETKINGLIKTIDVIEKSKSLIKKIKLYDENGKLFFTDIWDSENSNVARLGELAQFFGTNYFKYKEQIIHLYNNKIPPTSFSKLIIAMDASNKNYLNSLRPINDILKYKANINLVDIGSKLGSLKAGLSGDVFEQWASYLRIRDNLDSTGFSWVVDIIEKWRGNDGLVKDWFIAQVMESHLANACEQHSVLNNFELANYNNLWAKFKELDSLMHQARRFEIMDNHYQKVSRSAGAVLGNTGLIKLQINKKRMKFPIRKIMMEAGDTIQKLKPIFMMSPLSLASFIAPKSISFDLVIFDEASQVPAVDALGAVLRGKQLVVVGDSKQMPPTTFFDSVPDVDDEESYYENYKEEGAFKDIESILALMESQEAPKRLLRWHYRSKYKSLIAACNHLSYDNRLVLIPAADENVESNGFSFRHIPDSSYDRGGTRTNEKEAKIVAKAVLEHAKNSPELTLGVVAFSLAQRNCLEDEIESLSSLNPELNNFVTSHGLEKLFVKNLESVQGDQRDVIFISIGYGKTKEGYLAQSFGPINRDGGERRLNVLMSRAKLKMIIFSNFKSDDIKSDTKSLGVQHLKYFMKYAETGILDIPSPEGGDFDSEFERQVHSELVQRGYEVDNQVGSAGFLIDLAVKHSEKEGAYSLAIECDGAAYHSSYSARERDILRQRVLEDRGWVFHRIWSTAWFKNPKAEIDKVIDAINYAESRSTKPVNTKKKISIEREESKLIDYEVKRYKVPEWVIPYKLGLISYEGSKDYKRLYGDSYRHNQHVIGYLYKLVELEGPINLDLIIRRLRMAVNLGSAGSKFLEFVTRHLNAINGHYYPGSGTNKFFYIKETAYLGIGPEDFPDIVRSRENLDEADREFKYIPSIEVYVAIRKRVQGADKVNWTELSKLIAKDFGYKQCSQQMLKYFQKAYDLHKK